MKIVKELARQNKKAALRERLKKRLQEMEQGIDDAPDPAKMLDEAAGVKPPNTDELLEIFDKHTEEDPAQIEKDNQADEEMAKNIQQSFARLELC
jgi:hypothetical protein